MLLALLYPFLNAGLCFAPPGSGADERACEDTADLLARLQGEFGRYSADGTRAYVLVEWCWQIYSLVPDSIIVRNCPDFELTHSGSTWLRFECDVLDDRELSFAMSFECRVDPQSDDEPAWTQVVSSRVPIGAFGTPDEPLGGALTFAEGTERLGPE